jgi:hypothetical protein
MNRLCPNSINPIFRFWLCFEFESFPEDTIQFIIVYIFFFLYIYLNMVYFKIFLLAGGVPGDLTAVFDQTLEFFGHFYL